MTSVINEASAQGLSSVLFDRRSSLNQEMLFPDIPLLPVKKTFASPQNQVMARRVMVFLAALGGIIFFLSFLAILGFCIQKSGGIGGAEAVHSYFFYTIALGLSDLIKDTGIVLPVVFSIAGAILVTVSIFHMPEKIIDPNMYKI